MKKPIAIQLTATDSKSKYFRNIESPISAMCKEFSGLLNKEVQSATKVKLELSRSPFNGAKQIFSDFHCVSIKKRSLVDTFASSSQYFGLPFGGSYVAKELFNLQGKDGKREIKRFYAKITVLS